MGEKFTRPAPARKNRSKAIAQSSISALAPRNGGIAGGVRTLEPETDLQVQKAYLEQLFQSAPEGIAILDPDYHVTHVNAEFTRLFGYTQEEARGKMLGEIIVPAGLDAEVEFIHTAITQGQKVSLESKRVRKDGSVVDVSVLGMPVKVGGGQVAVYAIFRDISERKQAEVLQSALYRIAKITNSAGDLQDFYAAIHGIVGELMYARNFYIALYDKESKLLSFPYFVDEVDSTPAPKPLGKGLTEYVLQTGEPLLATPEVFDRLVRQGKAESIGAPSVDWLGVPLKTGNTTIGVLVVQSYSEDVRFGTKEKEILTFVSQHVATAIEHKRHEQALRESEARYRSLVQSAVYGIYRSTLEGHFLDVNPALISMLGYESAGEVLALDPRKEIYVRSGDRERLRQEYEQRGRLDNVEVKWRRKDGKAITVRLSGRAVGQEREDEVLEIIAEDVTERRILEDQFRQAQKMEAVGRLAGGVAHDFNNLLMVISGYTYVLMNQLGVSDPRRKKAEAIQEATERAAGLTRQLLAFGRKQVLELKVIDLNLVVSNISRLLRPLIGEDVEVLITCDRNLGRTKADPGQVEQVIMNLAVNARDAMPSGGKLIIETGNVELDDNYQRAHASVKPGRYVMLAVSDTGCGMDAETQSRIFEPFFTTKEKGKGTGLGLSTVYGIVKQSGGYIFAYSETGRGTTFKIYLPRVEESAPEVVPERRTRVGCRGSETVLLVEDEESVRELIAEALKAQGYNVLVAGNGQEALALAAPANCRIQLMITDVVMPGMSGRELATRLAESRPGTRVLYLSGYTEDAILHHGVLDPGTAFLQKPFSLDALACKVREVLDL
jgi:two-component system cell cycle sensor histidine kinase/response regulator CckA